PHFSSVVFWCRRPWRGRRPSLGAWLFSCAETLENDTVCLLSSSSDPNPKRNQHNILTATISNTGGRGFSSFSFLSDLQKAAAVAAEEISRNAVAGAETASKNFAELKDGAKDSGLEKNAVGESPTEKESDDEDDKLIKSALDKLEKASEDSLFSQSLKAFDRFENFVETFASGA
ncbi:hypothetical protein HN51_071132, partial [Arachis hypogaea]